MTSKNLLKNLLLGPLGLALAASPLFAETIFFADFEAQVADNAQAAVPDDPADPVNTQNTWFRAGGGSSPAFRGQTTAAVFTTTPTHSLYLGHRYHSNNVRAVLSNTWDQNKDYRITFDYRSTDAQEATLPSIALGAGNGTTRVPAVTLGSQTFTGSTTPQTVTLDVPATAVRSAAANGQNIYITILKAGSTGAPNRSSLYYIDNVTLTATDAVIPSPLLQIQPTTNIPNNGNPETLRIPISNLSGDSTTALTLGTVTASGAGASAVSNIVAPATIGAGETAEITFDFDPGAAAGTFSFNLNLPSNDASAASPRVIAVNVQVAANPVMTTGNTASFANDGIASSYSIGISNTSPDGVTNLAVSSVTATGLDAGAVSNIAFPTIVSPGFPELITFDFTPDLGPGNYTFNLEIASDDQSKTSPRVVPVTVSVTNPAIVVSTTPINLGTLAPAPGPQTITIPISNGGGTQDLVIDPTFTTLTGHPAYAITTIPGPIAPGGSADLVVTFTPGAEDGKFDASLKISSNDSANRQPTIPLTAIISPSTTPISIDFGTATSSVAAGYTRFTVSEGASSILNGVTVQLTSSSNNLAGGTGATGDLLMSDYAGTPFNGVANTYLSVRLTGLQSGTLKFLSSHNYNNSNTLPIDILFGEAGGTLSLVANDIGRPSTAFHSTTVEAGKTYEIRVLEQGTANVAYISGLMLWGSAVPEATGYAAWAQSLGLSGDPDDDFDKDGLADAIEFVTGSDPKAATSVAPMAVAVSGGNVVFTFHRADAAEVPGTTATVELGTTLDAWPDVLQVGADTATSSPTVDVAENGTEPDTITVTRPMAGQGKVFGRLKVEVATTP